MLLMRHRLLRGPEWFVPIKMKRASRDFSTCGGNPGAEAGLTASDGTGRRLPRKQHERGQ
jgi:hypothetical protein